MASLRSVKGFNYAAWETLAKVDHTRSRAQVRWATRVLPELKAGSSVLVYSGKAVVVPSGKRMTPDTLAFIEGLEISSRLKRTIDTIDSLPFDKKPKFALSLPVRIHQLTLCRAYISDVYQQVNSLVNSIPRNLVGNGHTAPNVTPSVLPISLAHISLLDPATFTFAPTPPSPLCLWWPSSIPLASRPSASRPFFWCALRLLSRCAHSP